LFTRVIAGFFAVLLLAVLTILAPSAQANQPPKAVAAAGVDPNTGQVLDQVTLFIGPADSGIPFTIAAGGSSDPDGEFRIRGGSHEA
jgi:Ni,Fe-hydrogenase III small subunit